MTTKLTRSQIARYLWLLDVEQSKPTLAALRDIVRAHLMRVPFENISKLYRWKISGLRSIPPADQFLEEIEQYHFGGTCYSNNYFLHLLLSALGFDVRLCGADMSKPDVHIVNIVHIDGREYIVDGGFAAPFIEPLPRDLTSDYVVALGGERYVLSPMDAGGRSRLTFVRDGVSRHGYLVNPKPRSIGEFGGVIEDSFRPEATFMNAVLLVKFGRHRSTTLRNMMRTECRGETSAKAPVRTRDDLVAAILEHFCIPAHISRLALDGLTIDEDAFS